MSEWNVEENAIWFEQRRKIGNLEWVLVMILVCREEWAHRKRRYYRHLTRGARNHQLLSSRDRDHTRLTGSEYVS
jgi:hypothetical protein